MSEIFFYLMIICFALLILRRLAYGIFLIFDCMNNKYNNNVGSKKIETLYDKSAWLLLPAFLFLVLYVIAK